MLQNSFNKLRHVYSVRIRLYTMRSIYFYNVFDIILGVFLFILIAILLIPFYLIIFLGLYTGLQTLHVHVNFFISMK